MAEAVAVLKLKDEFTKEFTRVDKRLDKFEKTFRGRMKTMQTAARGLRRGMRLVSAAIGVRFARAIARGTKRVVEFIGQGQGLEKSFHNLAKAMGMQEDVLLKLQAATLGAVSKVKLFELSNIAMSLRAVDSQKNLIQLMRVATRLSQVFGKDIKDAVEDLSIGLGRQSRLVLDNLGIVVRAEAAYEAYAVSLGISADSLTAAQRRTAFLNEALRQGIRTAKEAGRVVDTLTLSYQSMTAAAQEVAFSVGKQLAPIFSQVFEDIAQTLRLMEKPLADLTNAFLRVVFNVKELEDITRIFDPDVFALLIKEIAANVFWLILRIRDFLLHDLPLWIGQAMHNVGNAIKDIGLEFRKLEILGAKPLFALGTHLGNLGISIRNAGGELGKFATGFRKMAPEFERLAAEVGIPISAIEKLMELIAKEREEEEESQRNRKSVSIWQDMANLFKEIKDAGKQGILGIFEGLGRELQDQGSFLESWIRGWRRAGSEIKGVLQDEIFQVFKTGTLDARRLWKAMVDAMLQELARFLSSTIFRLFAESSAKMLGAFLPGVKEALGLGAETEAASQAVRRTGSSGPVEATAIPVPGGGNRVTSGFQKGGISFHEGLAKVHPFEAHIPLEGGRVPVSIEGGGMGGVTVENVNVNVLDMNQITQSRQFRNAVAKAVGDAMRRTPVFSQRV